MKSVGFYSGYAGLLLKKLTNAFVYTFKNKNGPKLQIFPLIYA